MVAWGTRENTNPQNSPTRCPPMTFRGFAVMLSGMANTINVEAPREAMMTAFCRLRK